MFKNVIKNELNKKQVFWILASVFIAVIPHIPRLPIWFPIFLIFAILIRWLVAIKKIKPIPQLFVLLLTLFSFIAVIYFHGVSLNRELSVTVLTLMTVMKLLETWRKRDAWMIVTLCYFVILTRFFYSQDMLLMLYLLVSMVIITHTLFILQHPYRKQLLIKTEIKQTLSLLTAGIPLAVLFFLFFPRLGSPIWGSPDLFGQGTTGISEEMSPGSISELFNDDSTAFRAIFEGIIPENKDLYWRGPVLWNFDGKTWTRRDKLKPISRSKDFFDEGLVSNYEIELEPTGQKYIFALDYAAIIPGKHFILSDSETVQQQEINQLKNYRATSVIKKYNQYELLNPEKMDALLSLPEGFNPETLKLINQWSQQTQDPEQLINRILNWFATDEFYYSYNPALLMGDTVDQFLFATKSGFCEHYASAFTVMMRAAGIPARVVTGYQGGIRNGGYLLVKQSDAHAWSEVWIRGKGWLRVDPTAAVSPLRVEQGSQALISENSRSWYDYKWTRELGEKYDSMRHKWNKWVRDFNVKRQNALFKSLGFDRKDGKTIALVLGIIILFSTIIVLAYLYLTRPKRKFSALDKIYIKFQTTFKKSGLVKTDSQGIQAFSKLALEKHPHLEIKINEFSELYLQLRFSKHFKRNLILEKRLLKIINYIAENIKN